MAKLWNLRDRRIMASYLTTHQPADDRVVILQDYEKGIPAATAARYINGKWYGALTGNELTKFSPCAIWAESFLGPIS